MEDSEILKILERAQKDSQWFSDNYDELEKKYESKILAVKDQAVIEEAESVDELVAKLEARKENPSLLLIEAIPPKGVSLIL